jgi:hypothetical protein
MKFTLAATTSVTLTQLNNWHILGAFWNSSRFLLSAQTAQTHGYNDANN